VGEGALKIGQRRQQSRRFFVMVGVVEMMIFVCGLMAKCAGSSQIQIQTSVVGKKIFRSSKVILGEN
jgi:hypothetical protein